MAAVAAVTVFTLSLAGLWELPHYEALIGLAPDPSSRVWLVGVLWAKSLVPLSVVVLGCAPLWWASGSRAASRVLFSALLLGVAWQLTDLWCQRRFGAEVSSYLPFVVAALRSWDQHAQWVGDPGEIAVSLAAWIGIGLGLFALLFWLARLGGLWLSRELSERTLARAAVVLAIGWVSAVLGASAALLRIEPDAARESLVFYLPLPSGPLFDRILRLRPEAACRVPTFLGLVPEAWEGRHEPQLLFQNPCSEALPLDGWSVETPTDRHIPLEGSVAPGDILALSLPRTAVPSRDTPQRLRIRIPNGETFARLEFSRNEIKRGEIVPNPGLPQAPIRRVEAAARRAYRDSFERLRSPTPIRTPIILPDQRLPNVLLIVMDSFRADAVRPETMPQLHRRAMDGLWGRRHYSGSNSSHLGLFTLLHGRSALAFDAILDRPPGDGAAQQFKALGYRTHFLSSGGIESWKRMDEYLNPDLFGELQLFRSDSGELWRQWPEQDRRSLEATRERLEAAGPPAFVVAFLMSLHFPYPYPKRYERFLPVSREDQTPDWRALFSARLDREKLWNRYRNAALAFDAMLEDFLISIDWDETLVVITGDHGESFGEDGTLVHGSRPSDAQLRVPLIVLGPNVPARAIDQPTSHVDVLPTIVRLATGPGIGGLGFEGRDLTERIVDDPLLLRLYRLAEPAPLLLVRGERRLLLRARTDVAEIDAVGFVDADGRLVLSDEPVDDGAWSFWVQRAFARASNATTKR